MPCQTTWKRGFAVRLSRWPSATGTLNDEGTTLLLVALGTAILAAPAGARQVAERRGTWPPDGNLDAHRSAAGTV